MYDKNVYNLMYFQDKLNDFKALSFCNNIYGFE